MVNNARTLLVNVARATDCPWEEYIPADFRPTELPGYLKSAWTVLFGTNPDRWMINYRAQQYLTILHGSEFSYYLTFSDSRIAYQIPPRTFTEIMPAVTVASSAGASSLSVSGVPVDDPKQGRLTCSYQIIALDGSHLTMQKFTTGDSDAGNLKNVTLTDQGGVSQSVPLFTSGVNMTFTYPLTPGSIWTIDTLATPSKSLTTILAELATLPESHKSQLFGNVAEEPLASFYRLWSDSRSAALSLTGFLLIWLFKHEEYRSNNE